MGVENGFYLGMELEWDFGDGREEWSTRAAVSGD